LRQAISFSITDISGFKEAALHWAQQYNEVTWLDSNTHKDVHSSFEGLLAVDAHTQLKRNAYNGFETLKEYHLKCNDWIFGYLSYDLKNDTEILTSNNADGLRFPELFFFQPKKIIQIIRNKVTFLYVKEVAHDINKDFNTINSLINALPDKLPTPPITPHIKLRIFKDEYFKSVNKVLDHIHRGDIYEANFCQEFYAEKTKIDPVRTFMSLNAISLAPFSAFLKCADKYALSASPERYLKKKGDTVISQPIKGTAKRSGNQREDEKLKMGLKTNAKERAENIMIVDLVRNDLSKSALKGSVKVEELCEVYSFEQVHQMISTISAKLPKTKNPVDILKETFPMGSMTGAPKISAMKIIEDLEQSKR